MKKPRRNNQRGDTLIEVLIAITVMGIVVAGAFAIMNRSLVSIINSAERTAVRAEVNSQTELLNFVRANDSDPANTNGNMWGQIKQLAVQSNDTAGKLSNAQAQCQMNENSGGVASNHGSFYLTLNSDGTLALNSGLTIDANGPNKASRATTGHGIWIDAIYYDNAIPYFDFYIKACWTPLGNSPDSQTMTIVRLYDHM